LPFTSSKLGVAMMAYAVLGRGMLSAQVPKVEELAADDIRGVASLQSINIEKNLRLRSALEAMARSDAIASGGSAITVGVRSRRSARSQPTCCGIA
jgi:aryl-alcohol dehydrogenase-like predicted oxidoreductase